MQLQDLKQKQDIGLAKNGKGVNMPYGKGTYGKKRGRPKKAKPRKMKAKKTGPKGIRL